MALQKIGEQNTLIGELEEKVKHLEKERLAFRKEERNALIRELRTEAFLLAKRNEYYSRLELRLVRQAEYIRRLIASRDELLRALSRLKEQQFDSCTSI